ncbi:MAG: hypothetical protein R3E53_12130 [Myxococcota bacterium]
MADLPTIPMDDPDYWQDPYPILREIRDRSRLARTPEGIVAVLRWDDAVDALKGEDFVAEGVEVLERKGFRPGDPMHTWRKNAIGTMEGADHRRVRSLAAAALSKRRMDGLRPLIRRHANALLDAKIEAGELEARLDYALPLPRRVMMDFLGLAADELASSQKPMAGVNIVDCFGPNVTESLRREANAAIQASMDHTARLYARRRESPRDDLLTHLVQARDEHGQLSEGELVTLFSTIFGSGASTASIIASGLLELARRRSRPRCCGRTGTLEAGCLRGDAPLPPGDHGRRPEGGLGSARLRPRIRGGNAHLGPARLGQSRCGPLGGSRALRPHARPAEDVAQLRHRAARLPRPRDGAGDRRGGARRLRRALRRDRGPGRGALDPLRDGEQARGAAPPLPGAGGRGRVDLKARPVSRRSGAPGWFRAGASGILARDRRARREEWAGPCRTYWGIGARRS